jgi:hypothetical protein
MFEGRSGGLRPPLRRPRMRTQRERDERPRVPPTPAGRSLALWLDIAPGGVTLAQVDKLERVSTAREASPSRPRRSRAGRAIALRTRS